MFSRNHRGSLRKLPSRRGTGRPWSTDRHPTIRILSTRDQPEPSDRHQTVTGETLPRFNPNPLIVDPTASGILPLPAPRRRSSPAAQCTAPRQDSSSHEHTHPFALVWPYAATRFERGKHDRVEHTRNWCLPCLRRARTAAHPHLPCDTKHGGGGRGTHTVRSRSLPEASRKIPGYGVEDEE